jgi:hypothetical protein
MKNTKHDSSKIINIIKVGEDHPAYLDHNNLLIECSSYESAEIIRQIISMKCLIIFEMDAQHFNYTKLCADDPRVVFIYNLDKCPPELKSKMNEQLEYIARGTPVIAFTSQGVGYEKLLKDYPVIEQLFGCDPEPVSIADEHPIFWKKC